MFEVSFLIMIGLVVLYYVFKQGSLLKESENTHLSGRNELARAKFKLNEIMELHARYEQRVWNEVLKHLGSMEFSLEMTVREALDIHPMVKKVLEKYHIGGCSSCGVNESERLKELEVSHGVPVKEMIEELNNLARV